MNTSNLTKSFKSLQTAVMKHSPEILTGMGIAGMLTTTVLAVKATPKALRLIKNEEKLREESNSDVQQSLPMTKVDIVKTTWKCYIPAAVTGTVSIACLVGASSVNSKRNAALATAYTLSETALREYKDKVVETIGERKEQVVRDNIAKDKIEKNPVSNNEVIITGKGETLCYDVISGRYFKSDIDKLNKSVNDLNRRMMDEMYISVNDFYCEVGLNPVAVGEELGWNIDRGFLELDFSSQLADDGTPCLVIGYSLAPRYDFRKIF